MLLSTRCGAGTNNVPVARMTELGIPVFNTPGANANAVKELVVCGMFLGSRKIIDGINHMKDLGSQGLAKERVEKDKSMFGGRELMGKTLAVIGLGKITRYVHFVVLSNIMYAFVCLNVYIFELHTHSHHFLLHVLVWCIYIYIYIYMKYYWRQN
jgi:lactate dehydrogenase-like 2-hydroxyacid dehydrogenase